MIGPKDLLYLKNQFQDWNKVCIKNEKKLKSGQKVPFESKKWTTLIYFNVVCIFCLQPNSHPWLWPNKSQKFHTFRYYDLTSWKLKDSSPTSSWYKKHLRFFEWNATCMTFEIHWFKKKGLRGFLKFQLWALSAIERMCV